MDITPIKKWYKKKKWWAVSGATVLVIVVTFLLIGDEKPVYETILVKRDVLLQEVSVTGKIRPAQSVDLQFETAGRIAAINYKVGDKVNSGAVVASLENQDLQAAVTSAKADLDETIRHFNSLSDPSVSSSLRVELTNAESNLDQVRKKAEGDLLSKYSGAFSDMREAMTQIDTSSAVLEYIRKTHLEGKDWDIRVKQYQSEVDYRVGEVRSVFPQIDQSGVTISPALYGQIDLALPALLNGCQSLRSAFTYLQEQMQSNPYMISSSTDRASVNTEATSISSDLSAIYTAIQEIIDQRILNNKNIADADAKLATAKAAFPTNEDILQKEAALLSAQSQLRKSLVIAPFAGTIGKIDVERGQTVTSSVVIVSLVSTARYQIEANITEIDIGKVRSGDSAVLTLDAYGTQTVFNARVSTIDTAATIVDGVTTYKTIFNFEGDIDPNIRPNMTANIDIETAKKEDVIAIPQRAVISRNGSKIVRIYHGVGTAPEERFVQVGISGKDGYVEILSGLSEGERVITFINE